MLVKIWIYSETFIMRLWLEITANALKLNSVITVACARAHAWHVRSTSPAHNRT